LPKDKKKKEVALMRRITMLFTVAAMMAVLMSISAGPASALVIGGNNHNGGNKFDRNDHFFGDRFNNRDGDFSFEIGDVRNESGNIETENDFEISGNNNNACLGQLQFGQTGNFTNQQGVGQFFSEADDVEFGGGDITFAPENETGCEQDVEQATAASSWGW